MKNKALIFCTLLVVASCLEGKRRKGRKKLSIGKGLSSLLTPGLQTKNKQEVKTEEKAPPIPAPAVNTQVAVTIDDEALALVQKFVDLKDTSLSWIDFAQQMEKIFQKDAQYKTLAKAFKDVTHATWTSYIGYTLSWHARAFPPKTYSFIEKYSGKEMAHITATRIKLNKK